LNRRRFVEKELFDEYTQEYGRLKEKVPVYFYLYPQITTQKAVALSQQRTKHAEAEPGVLMVKIRDLEDITNITFTLNDSLTAYRKKTIDAGIKCRGPQPDGIVLPDHNKVFPFSMIEEIHRKYAKQDMVYEVQVWDYELLERISYTILGEEKA
jgi:ribosomal protein L35AE/L33A